MPWTPTVGRICKDCGRTRDKHDVNDGGRIDCRSDFASMYGPDNPMVAWAREHAPRELRRPANTIVEPE